MATIKKLLKSAPRMRGVTPVPNGPLVKKNGSTLKKGGKVKKAGSGDWVAPVAAGVGALGLGYLLGNRHGKKKQMAKMQGEENEDIEKAKAMSGLMKKGGKIKKARTGAWQRKEGKNPEGGLNAKGVASYRAENPGSKLKTAVTTKPSKLKPGSKSANRRKSFCSRMSGMKKTLTSAKTANDPNSRINKSLRKWNC